MQTTESPLASPKRAFFSSLPGELIPPMQTLWEEATRVLSEIVNAEAEVLAVARETFGAGGKRVRLLLCGLSGLAARAPLEVVALHAAAAEMVHAATLVHDDVIDHGLERRGKPAAHVLFGNKRAVLGGDAILAEALRLLLQKKLFSETEALLAAISGMVQGEYLQLSRQYLLPPDEEACETINRQKTALLFGWCTTAALRYQGAPQGAISRAASFGEAIGEAFQLIDDLLDIIGDPRVTGKPAFQDLKEGKITLPLAWLLARVPSLSGDIERYWSTLLRGEDRRELLSSLTEAARAAGLEGEVRGEAARRLARGLAGLDAFPDSAPKRALQELAENLSLRIA